MLKLFKKCWNKQDCLLRMLTILNLTLYLKALEHLDHNVLVSLGCLKQLETFAALKTKKAEKAQKSELSLLMQFEPITIIN